MVEVTVVNRTDSTYIRPNVGSSDSPRNTDLVVPASIEEGVAPKPRWTERLHLGTLKPAWDFPLIAGLLAGAGVVDYITGTSHIEAHLYGFPVIFATWRRGWQLGLAACLVAAVINASTEWSVSGYPPPHSMVADEMVRLVLFLVSIAGTSVVRHQNRTIREQRDVLVTLNQRSADEMGAARRLQMAMTQSCVAVPTVEMASYLQPARILCGDLLHVSTGPDGTVAILLADVSGKGSPAALAGAVMLGLLQEITSRYTSPAQTLASLNPRLVDFLPTDMFITAFYAILDPVTGSLVYANAGHEPPIVATARGLEDLQYAGLPIGMWQAGDYEDQAVQMNQGDLLFVYSDGLTDHRLSAKERVSRERVVAIMARGVEMSCEDLVRSIVMETVGDRVPSEDDVTVLALRYCGDADISGGSGESAGLALQA